MRRAAAVLLFALVSVPSLRGGERPTLPQLTAADAGGAVALDVVSMSVRATLRGHLARTEFELVFRNRLPRVVGGNFFFPLPPDAEVSDVGLYFDGRLRRAVAVERSQAKRAYEETVHRRVDPILAEWSDARGFRFRVYPIPAGGEKKVFIAYDEDLSRRDYRLDLRYGKQLEEFSITIDAVEVQTPAVSGLLRLTQAGRLWSAKAAHHVVDTLIRITPRRDEEALGVWSEGDQMFYVAAAPVARREGRTIPPASRVVVFWDVSGSSVQQNRERLQRFFDRFLAVQRPGCEVVVIPFHIQTERGITARSSAELIAAIERLPAIGGTNLIDVITRYRDLASASSRSTRFVLVTDGFSSLGSHEDLSAGVRSIRSNGHSLLVVSASEQSNDSLLSDLASATGGWSIDLTRQEADDAAGMAMLMPVDVSVKLGTTSSAVTLVGEMRVPVAAAMRRRLAAVDLAVSDANRTDGQRLTVRELFAPVEVDLVRRAWAQLRLRELTRRGGSSGEIAEHGLRYRLLTPRTSLLVLETWRDYEMYRIPMPEDVSEEKRAFEAREGRRMPRPIPPQTPSAGDPRAVWFVRGWTVMEGGPLPGVTVRLIVDGATIDTAVTDADGRFWLSAPYMPKSFRVEGELSGLERSVRHYKDVPTGQSIELAMRPMRVAEAITVTAEAEVLTDVGGEVSGEQRTTEQVSLRRGGIVDEEEAIARLRAASTDEARLTIYLGARDALGGDKSFHVAAAQIFQERSSPLALRVLTDLAESHAHDAPLLRILGRVAEGWGNDAVARLLFLRALEISPAEPQTLRELILLAHKQRKERELAKWAAQYRLARRDERMVEVGELIDRELARGKAMVADLRADPTAALQVELMWDTNYTYVDLHVVEPSGEEVAWNHERGASGSEHTGGNTEGYGPQIYRSPHGSRGEHRIDVLYYSSDDTEANIESLAHVIVLTRAGRSDHLLVLTRDGERRLVTRVKANR